MIERDYTTTAATSQATKPVIAAKITRVLLVDNQPAVRVGLQLILAAEPDLCVIGEASDGQAALDLAASLRPDIVLMDVDMPRKDGIATTSALRLICPQASIIILSLHDDAHTRLLAEDAGAAAFVAKSMPVDALLAAIHQVAHPSLPRMEG
jgi:two-component system, NarL family, response regulator NreC